MSVPHGGADIDGEDRRSGGSNNRSDEFQRVSRNSTSTSASFSKVELVDTDIQIWSYSKKQWQTLPSGSILGDGTEWAWSEDRQ